MPFKKGDRVKIPKGAEGTVRYVGKVSWASGTHVGVELDTSDGDNNGTKKGKEYFKCKKKYGIIEKEAYFTAVKGKKKSGGDSKKPRSSAKGKKLNVPITDDADDDEDDDVKVDTKKGKKGGGKSAAPAIQTTTIGIQTEVPTEVVENEYYCKIITRLYTEENDKLRKECDEAKAAMTSLQERADKAEARVKQLEYEKQQQAIELDPDSLREKLEMKEIENEELNIKLEIANIEIEELKEKQQQSLDVYVDKVAADKSQHAEVVRLNQEMQQQLSGMVKVCQDLLESKDKRINRLATEHDYVDSLSARLKDLLSVEQEVLGLKSKVKELEDKCASLVDADRMCRALTEYNNQLEGELGDWREYVLDVEAERKILEELNEHDEKLITDLAKEKKDMEVQLVALDKEHKQLKIEKSDLEKQIFELRNKMERQQLSAADDLTKYNFATLSTASNGGGADSPNASSNPTDDDEYVLMGNPTDAVMAMNSDNSQPSSASQSQAQKMLDNSVDRKMEAIWNENIRLQSQMDGLRSMVMSQVQDSVAAQQNYVQYELMKQYLPADSSNVDYRGIQVLAVLQSVLYKAKACRDLLERLFNDPSSAAMKNPKLALMSHTLCPYLLSQENYIRAIQEGFVSIAPDDEEAWKTKALRFEVGKFRELSKTYDLLLSAIESAGKSNELSFDIDKLDEHEKMLKGFVEKQFVNWSPDRPKKDDVRCAKSVVLQNVSESLYRFQSLSIKLNQFNAALFDLVHAPAQTTASITVASSAAAADSNQADEESKLSEQQPQSIGGGGDYEETMEDVQKNLKIGAVEKLFRLTNEIVSSTHQIVHFCQPVELGYGTEKYAHNLLRDANKTSVKWGQLMACKYISGQAVQRVTGMLDQIRSKVNVLQVPQTRVANLNKIIEAEEEQNAEGLIKLLERAYNTVSDVRKIISSTLFTTLKSTDEMPQHLNYEKFTQPYWEHKAEQFRVLFERQKENQDRMNNLEASMKQSDNEHAQIEKELKSKNQTIAILQDQNVAEKEKSVNLAQTQNTNTELSSKNEKLRAEKLKMAQQIAELEDAVTSKSAHIERYKKAMSRMKEQQSPLNKTQLSVPQPENQKNGVGGSGGGGGGGSHESQSTNIRRGGRYYRARLVQDRDVEYSTLLQETIQTLRRKMTQLTIAKKLINCELNLKPLPFTLLRETVIQKLNEEVNSKTTAKKKKRRKKKKQPPNGDDDEAAKTETDNDKDNGNESEYEWVTEDEDDAEEDIDLIGDDHDNKNRADKMVKLMQLQREKEVADKMQIELNSLTSHLDKLRSQPLIVDLTKKSRQKNDLSQQLIGRQMKLRDVHIQCQQIKNDLNKQMEQENSEQKLSNDAEPQQMGQILGEISIPNSSLKSLGLDRTHKVLLPAQQFGQLQTSFLW